jgi:hypothetical protein
MVLCDMPTAMKIGRHRVVIYPNDHPPCHVDVIWTDHEVLYNLNCPDGPVKLRENYGFSMRDLSQIEDALNAELALLCEKWREIHGEY